MATHFFIYIFQREKAITKHLSSSTEDLILLFKAEKNIVKFLKSDSTKELFNTKDIKEIIESYLKSVDFDETTETEDYVFHPVNAYHLLKRTIDKKRCKTKKARQTSKRPYIKLNDCMKM